MGIKRRTTDSPQLSFVANLGARHGREVHEQQPNLTTRALEELAHEAWWNVAMYEAEEEGIDIDDSAMEGRFCRELVAAFTALKQAAGPVPRWQTPRLNELRAALTQAGVAAARLSSVDELISESGLDDGDVRGLEQFCELFEYVYGLRDSFPTRWQGGQPYFEIDTREWKGLFGDVADWGDVELRLCTWIWQLPAKKYELGKDIVLELAPDGIRADPDADTFAIVRKLLRDVGELDSQILSRCIEAFMYAGLTADHRVTSFGRWVAAQPVERVLPLVKRHKRVSYYATMLLHHDQAMFDANLDAFKAAVADSDGWKLDLSEAMLRCAPEAYEQVVLDWADGLSSPGLRSHMAIYLCRSFGDEHKQRVLDMTSAAIEEFGDKDSSAVESLQQIPELAAFAEYPNSSIKLCLVATVLQAFGKQAFDAIRHYRYRNEGWMIRYYELLGKHLPGDADALALLIDGLLKDLPDSLGGLLTYDKYIARLNTVLGAYDTGPYKSKIAKRFAGDDRAALQPLRTSGLL